MIRFPNPVSRRMFCAVTLSGALLIAIAPTLSAAEPPFPANAKRVLFLGDSITHAGGYIVWIETQLRLAYPDLSPDFINLGLPSETCSGLSEPDHPFPRPDVHERLDRALKKTKPDVVVACYGMNDGIYYPFGEERFAAYRSGVQRLIKKVKASGAKLILMTPPPFDPLPLREKNKLRPKSAEKFAWFAIYEDYDDVLDRYADYVMQQSKQVDMTIDLHTPVNSAVAKRRAKDPKFRMSNDGVHVDDTGHRLLGRTILSAWKAPQVEKPDAQLLKLVQQKHAVLHAAWVSHVGHKRPGVKAGLPLDQALEKASSIEKQINARLAELK